MATEGHLGTWLSKDVAVVVKTVLASHFGVGAPPILEHISSRDWDVHWGSCPVSQD